MISDISSGRPSLLAVAVTFFVALGLPAHAQQAQKPAAAPIWPADPADKADPDDTTEPADKPEAADANDPDMKDIDVSKLDWSQLSADASAMNDLKTKAPPKKADAGGDMKWSSANQVNGSTGVSVKQSVSPYWDARVGADMNVARQPTTMSELLAEKSANGGNLPQSSGTAWAAITAPGAGSLWDKTAVEARVDPGQDQTKLGTSLSKSVPLADKYSITLQNGYNMTDQGALPVPGSRSSRDYGTDQSAKLDIGDSGASVTAGQSLSSTDDKWLRKIGAEQKFTGGVTISGSIGETPQGVTNKSITAGFKHSW
jgi:hypothetical protein